MRNWNKKQQVPVQRPRGFHGCETGRKFSARRKGCWKGTCGTGIKSSKCPYSAPEDFMAAKPTGNSLREEKGAGRALAELEWRYIESERFDEGVIQSPCEE